MMDSATCVPGSGSGSSCPPTPLEPEPPATKCCGKDFRTGKRSLWKWWWAGTLTGGGKGVRCPGLKERGAPNIGFSLHCRYWIGCPLR